MSAKLEQNLLFKLLKTTGKLNQLWGPREPKEAFRISHFLFLMHSGNTLSQNLKNRSSVSKIRELTAYAMMPQAENFTPKD